MQEQNLIRNLDDFLKIVCKVEQFDWGDFFLFKEFPLTWNPGEGELYPYLIRQSDTTIRAVDDQYIYVYTPYTEVVEMLMSKYVIESHKIDVLEKLDYPE